MLNYNLKNIHIKLQIFPDYNIPVINWMHLVVPNTKCSMYCTDIGTATTPTEQSQVRAPTGGCSLAAIGRCAARLDRPCG